MFMNKLSSHIGSEVSREIMSLECVLKSELGTCDPPDVFRFQLPLNQESKSILRDDRSSGPKYLNNVIFLHF